MAREQRTCVGRFFSALTGLFNAYRITFLHLLRRPITEEYPEYKRELPIGSRGKIILTVSPDGEESS